MRPHSVCFNFCLGTLQGFSQHTRVRTPTLSLSLSLTHKHTHTHTLTHTHTHTEIHTCVRCEYINNPPYRLDILILFRDSKFTSPHFLVCCLAVCISTLLLATYFQGFPKLRLPFRYKYSKLNCITDCKFHHAFRLTEGTSAYFRVSH